MGTGDSSFNSIVVDASGNIYVVGYQNGTVIYNYGSLVTARGGHNNTDRMAKYLTLLRTAAKLTQNQVAKRLAITRASVIGFETKKRKIPFQTYLALAFIFLQMRRENHK